MARELGTWTPPAHSTAPGSPIAGQIYYDLEDQEWYGWAPTAGVWKPFAASSGVTAGFGIDSSGSTVSVDLNEHKVGPTALGSDYAISTTMADAGLSITLPSIGTYLIHMVAHVNFVSGTPGQTVVQLMVNSVAIAGTLNTVHTVGRITMAKSFLHTTAGASHVAKVQAQKNTTGSVDLKATDTVLFALQVA